MFPAARLYGDVATGEQRRHHLHGMAVQRAMQGAVRERESQSERRVTRFGTRWRRISWRMATTYGRWQGHTDVSTTMLYTHVLNRGGLGVRSPADELGGG